MKTTKKTTQNLHRINKVKAILQKNNKSDLAILENSTEEKDNELAQFNNLISKCTL